MPKSRKKPKQITVRGLLKKIRKPPAPPSRVHTERKKYKRERLRVLDENET